MLIEGAEGVTDIAGALFFGARELVEGSLIAIVGIGCVTDIKGAFTLEPLSAGLTEIDGASWTEIAGVMECAGVGLERAEGAWETFIVGTGGATVGGVLTFLERLLASGSGRAGGSS